MSVQMLGEGQVRTLQFRLLSASRSGGRQVWGPVFALVSDQVRVPLRAESRQRYGARRHDGAQSLEVPPQDREAC